MKKMMLMCAIMSSCALFAEWGGFGGSSFGAPSSTPSGFGGFSASSPTGFQQSSASSATVIHTPVTEESTTQISPNTYGLGVNSDQYGRPSTYQPRSAATPTHDPFVREKPNAYGLGTGSDQYGRPTKSRSW